MTRMVEGEKSLTELLEFSVKETLANLGENTDEDPSSKVIEDMVEKYSISKEGAWSLYKPVFWYLSKQEIINVNGSRWNLRLEYQSPSKNTMNKLIDGILRSYADTLHARWEKYFDES